MNHEASVITNPAQEALRQQTLQEIADREAALLQAAGAEAANTNLWDSARNRLATEATGRVDEALFRHNASAGHDATDPVERVFAAVAQDRTEDAMDVMPGAALEQMLAIGQVPTNAAAVTEAVRLLTQHGASKFARYGSTAQLQQAVDIIGRCTGQIPGFDPEAAGLGDVKQLLVDSVATIQADQRTKPNFDYAYPERGMLSDNAHVLLEEVSAVEATQDATNPYATETAPTTPIPEADAGAANLATTEDVTGYLDYLEDDLQTAAWDGDPKQGQRTMITALRSEIEAAGPGASPQSIIAARLARLQNASVPQSASQRTQLNTQIDQLQRLLQEVSTPEGTAMMRLSTEVWREGEPTTTESDANTAMPPTEELPQEQMPKPNAPETRGGMTDKEVEEARLALNGLVISSGKPRKPEVTDAPETTTGEDYSKVPFESLDHKELTETSRRIIDSLYAKYGLRALTTEERKAALDEIGENFTGDIEQRAADIRKYALTAKEHKVLQDAKAALGRHIREGDPEARELSREMTAVDRYGKYSESDPARLTQMLTAIGFRPERVKHYADELRNSQQKLRPGQKAVLMVTFTRSANAPDPNQGVIDDSPMVWMTQTSKS